MRLDRFLANQGFGTRTEVKKIIKSGAVTLDGIPVKDSATQFDENKSIVSVAGQIISYKSNYYYVLNKPAGVITASRDKNASTVLDLLSPDDKKRGIVPVGRLDKDTVGLIILTDDGELNHMLTSPKSHVDKTYLAVLDKPIADSDMTEMEKGIDIGDDDLTLPCACKKSKDANTYYLTIHEGRYHQVKRMFSHFGSEVIYLKRISIGGLTLPDNLPEGDYIEYTKEELVNAIKEYTGCP